MPGVRYSVHNPDGESYVPDQERFAADQAARQADWMARAALMKQSANAMQAQLYDNAQNRSLQKELTGTAAQRFGYDANLQKDRYGGEIALEGTRQTGMTDRSRLQYEPQNRALNLQEAAYKDLQPQRELAASQAKYQSGRLGTQNEVDSLVDSQVLGGLKGSVGGGGALSSRDLSAIVRARAGLKEDPADALFRQAIDDRVKNATPEELPGLLEASRSGDASKIPVHKGLNQRIAQDQAAAMTSVKPELDRVRNFIRANNWSISGNQNELRKLYDAVMQRVTGLGASPEATAYIENELKQTMRDALAENGLVFEAKGSDKTRANFGL